MADVLTKEQRHKNMKNIRAKDTKIEVILRKALWDKGYRYRKNYKKLPGCPDIVLTKYKIAIFCEKEISSPTLPSVSNKSTKAFTLSLLKKSVLICISALCLLSNSLRIS